MSLKNSVAATEWFFDRLGTDVQQVLLSAVTLEDQELPAYGYFASEDSWFFTTSRRVAWSRPGFRHQMKYGEIGDAGLSEMDRIQAKDLGARSEEISRIKGSSPWFFLADK